MAQSGEYPQELLGTITRPLIIPSQGPATMRIASEETGLGYMIINASDFDPATMTAYEPFIEPSREPSDAPAKGRKAKA